MSGQYQNIILLPNINIHNANALSSPFTVGFPAMTSWLGATHALQRILNQQGFNITIKATGVVCHHCDLQTYRGDNDYVASIIGTANPLDKTGARSAFIEEARCHLNVSLALETNSIPDEQKDELIAAIAHTMNVSLKMASGDIQCFDFPECFTLEKNKTDDSEFRKIIRKLMPGYALIERRELMIQAMQQGQDPIDALLDYLAIHHQCHEIHDEKTGKTKIEWQSTRKRTPDDKSAGWLVPIATGFHGISGLGRAKNQRDPNTPHRFAESIVTLGEFKMPYRLDNINELLWRYQIDEKTNIYQCTQQLETIEDNPFDDGI